MKVSEIRKRGYDWPKYAIVEEYSNLEGSSVDIASIIVKMESSRAFYRKQLNDAFAFKMNSGADYGDFTDRFDEYARKERQLAEAISYLREILELGI